MSDAMLEKCSCSALRQATRHVTKLYDESLKPVELGVNQYSILARLDEFGPKTVQDLAALLVMDRSTLGHLLRPLEKRSLVRLEVSDRDRRNRVIALTPVGSALMAKARPLWAKAERRFREVFGTEAALGLRAILKQITRAEFGRAR